MLCSHVSPEYVQNQGRKQLGMHCNTKFKDAVNAAILTAKRFPTSAVTQTGIGCAFVCIKSQPGQRYSVTGAAEGYERPQCLCNAGKLGDLRWHVIKVLLARGATEGALLECLGVYFGTRFGGYGKLYEEMAKAAALEIEAADAGEAAEGGEAAGYAAFQDVYADRAVHPDSPAPHCGEPSPVQADVGSAPVLQQCDRVSAACRDSASVAAFATEAQLECEWAALKRELPPGCSGGELRQHVFFALQKAAEFVKLSKAAGALAQTAATCSLAVMLPNPDNDLGDNSLVRKRDFMDPQRKKQRTGQVPPLVAPFLKLPTAKRKVSVKAEVDAAAEAEERAAARRNAQPITAATYVLVPAAADLAPMATTAQAGAASSSEVQRPKRERRLPATLLEFV